MSYQTLMRECNSRTQELNTLKQLIGKLHQKLVLAGLSEAAKIEVEIEIHELEARTLEARLDEINRQLDASKPTKTVFDDDNIEVQQEIIPTRGILANAEIRRDVAEITICKSVPSVIYALIDRTLFVSKDYARTWSPATTSANLIAADPDHPAIIYALRTNGLFISNDFGETWHLRSDAVCYRVICSGRFTVHPEDNQKMVYSDTGGVYVSSDQGQTWRKCFSEWCSSGTVPWYYAIDKKRPGILVAAFYEYGLCLTEDWGETWSEINPPPTGDKPHPGIINPLAVDFQTSSIWYADLGAYNNVGQALTQPKGLFVTHNKGKSWEQGRVEGKTTDLPADYIEIVENAGQAVIYTAHPGLPSYRSQDNGWNWAPVTIDWGGLPDGFDQAARHAVLLAPVDALTKDGLVYLKTQHGLLKSTDNGRTWFY